MGTFSTRDWLVSLAVVISAGLVIYFAFKTSKRNPEVPLDQISGIGGWLFILAVGQCLAIVRMIAKLINSAVNYPQAAKYSGGEILLGGELFLYAGVIFVQVFVAIALLRRWTSFPKLFLYHWIFVLSWPLIDVIWVHMLTNVPVAQLLEVFEFKRIVRDVLTAGVSVWYTAVSIRVRNTFTE